MKVTKALLFLALIVSFSRVSAQKADYYSAAKPGANGAKYLFYKPDSTFAKVTTYDKDLTASALEPAIQEYGTRTILYQTDTFTIETDRTTAVYFKAKNGKRELFLQHYLNENKCWTDGSVAWVEARKGDLLTLMVDNINGEQIMVKGQQVDCGGEVLGINVEELYAGATGKQIPSKVEKWAQGVSLVQENKALLIRLPRESLAAMVSVNFYLYSGKRKVKEFLNMKASENVLYIGDLPKGKYKYKVELYDGTLVREGDVTLQKMK